MRAWEICKLMLAASSLPTERATNRPAWPIPICESFPRSFDYGSAAQLLLDQNAAAAAAAQLIAVCCLQIF